MTNRSAHCCLCGEPRKLTQHPVASFSNNQRVVQMAHHRPMLEGRWEQSPQLLVSVNMWRNGGTNEHTHMCDGCIVVGLQHAKTFVDSSLASLGGEPMKTAKEMRQQAADLARLWASERDRDGDPEGADIIRDLAKHILRIPLK